jgi:hypothetical protein
MGLRMRWTAVAACVVTGLVAAGAAYGQGRQGGQPPAPARVSAPIDVTGYWVSLITEDWSFRMVTPPKGDYRYLPVNAEARRAADTWDPARDEAAGDQCKGYGPIGVMRLPGRLRIAWEEDNTLRIDTDTGMQTRLLHFGGEVARPAARTLQGHSVAQWDLPVAAGIAGFNRPRAHGDQGRTGGIKVVTAGMTPGYLRKNGVPYGEQAVLTEYFVRLSDAGEEYLAITAMLDDPQYLTRPYIRTVQFKKQPDGSGWDPTPCSAW